MMHGLGRFEWFHGDVYHGMWSEVCIYLKLGQLLLMTLIDGHDYCREK